MKVLLFVVVLTGLQLTHCAWLNDLSAILSRGLSEATTIGALIGNLTYGNLSPGEVVTYSTTSEYFDVNPINGMVTLKKLLVYRLNKQLTVVFVAKVNDRPEDQRGITFPILPINHPPSFDNPTYRATIQYNLPVGSEITSSIIVSDTDEGPNGTITVRCDATNTSQECDTFSVIANPLDGASDRLRVTVRSAKSLDPNVKSYSILLVATDSGNPPLSATAYLLVTVESLQDTRPRFPDAPIIIQIKEFEPLTNNVTVVRVIDGRQSAPGNGLDLKISDDPRQWFKIQKSFTNSDGIYNVIITPNRNISLKDNNNVQRYQFGLLATQTFNNQQTQVNEMTYIVANIQDVNDHSPTFDQSSYSVNVSEGLTNGATVAGLSIFVTDDDLDDNAYFELSVDYNPSPPTEIFGLLPVNGQGQVALAVIVNKPEFVRYASNLPKRYNLTLTARETKTAERRSSSANVYIQVISTANHPPYFPNQLNPIVVFDDIPVNSIISTFIRAVDDDEGNNGMLSYSITNNSNANIYFSINPQSGVLSLKSRLNATLQSSYPFYVVATDGAGLNATLPIFISVADSRRQGPQYDPASYLTNCTEMTTDLFPPVTIKPFLVSQMISDRRIQCNVQEDKYSSIFSFNSNTGSFTMLKGVDYMDTPNKEGFFDISVLCYVVSYPEITRTSTIVRVNIIDTNNHAPYFVPKDQTFKTIIKDNTPPVTKIVQLNSTDDDVGINAQVNYFILNGAQNNFVIDRYNGLLSVSRTPRLRPETTYNITVIAVDLGQPPLTGTTTVFVTVIATVSRPPTFPINEYTFYVSEGSRIGFSVGTAAATSLDAMATINYTFLSYTWKAYNSTGVQINAPVSNWFGVDNSAGITVQGNIVYNVASKVTVLLEARVTNPDPDVTNNLNASVPVTIFILRTEDTDVVRFSPSVALIYISIMEQQPVGTIIYQFHAFYYATSSSVSDFTKFSNGPQQAYLSLESTTGILKIMNTIYYSSLNPTKNITFNVTARAPSPSEATALVMVVVNVRPLDAFGFKQTEYNFTVYSNQPPGTNIGQVTAIGQPNSEITYVFNPDSNVFQISNRGNILLKQSLQPPSTQYTLMVKANDGNRDYYAIVRIQVIPVRILPPQFKNEPYRFVTITNSSVPIGQVLAEDPNPYNPTSIKYAIVGSNPGTNDAFIISQSTGLITVNWSNVRNSSSYRLNVSATDSSSNPLTSYTTVDVIVNSVFVRPQFSAMNTTYNIYYGDSNVKILTVQGTAPPGRTLTYYVDTSKLPPGMADYFVMDSTTGTLSIRGTVDGTMSKEYSLILIIGDGTNNATKEINVGIYSNAPPTYNCLTSPLGLSALDGTMNELKPSVAISVKPANIENPDACSNNMPGTTFYYALLDGTLPDVNNYFQIDTSTGVISPKDVMNAYLLNNKTLKVVVASSKDDLETAKGRPGTILTGVIKLSGRDARNPTFNSSNPYCPGTGYNYQTGVLDMSQLNTPVLKVQAGDCDLPGFRQIVYRLLGFRFIYYANVKEADQNAPSTNTGAFSVDSNTGQVYTSVEELRPFYNGFFRGQVEAASASDPKLKDLADMTLYIVRESQFLRMTFNKSVDKVRAEAAAFSRAVNTLLSPDNQIVASPITTYINSDGTRDFKRSSMCYFLLERSTSGDYFVVTGPKKPINETALREFGIHKLDDTCYAIGVTTKWWSGYWFLWFILIAFSILVFVVALILTCCVCLYWPMNLKEITKARPYVVFDNQPVSIAGSVADERW